MGRGVAAGLALWCWVLLQVASAAGGDGSSAGVVGLCNATAFTEIEYDPNVATCQATSQFSFTSPSANATAVDLRLTPAEAKVICRVPACRAVYKTLRGLAIRECYVAATRMRLYRDILEPLAASPNCTNSVDGSGNSDDGVVALMKPPKPSPPAPPSVREKKKSSTVAVVVGVTLAVVAVVVVTMAVVWRKRQRRAAADKTRSSSSESGVDTDPTGLYNTVGSPHDIGNAHADTLWSDQELLQWRVSVDGIEDIRVIGTGAYAVVYLVRDRSERLFASKRLIHDHATRDKARAFLQEIKLVGTLVHPRIVAFVGAAWTTEADLQALFEYLPNGDLCTHLAKTSRADEREVWDATKLQIAIDVADALVYVHAFSPPLVHRDLKSRNVLLGDGMEAKLSDFGVSRYHSDALTMTTGVGTGRWLAPEVLNGGGDYSERCDIYSLGMVLVELDSHRLPFADVRLPEMTILQQVSQHQLTPTLRDTCPLALRQLALQCLTFEPNQRPSAVDVASALRAIAATTDFMS
jgi:hypothetical protein